MMSEDVFGSQNNYNTIQQILNDSVHEDNFCKTTLNHSVSLELVEIIKKLIALTKLNKIKWKKIERGVKEKKPIIKSTCVEEKEKTTEIFEGDYLNAHIKINNSNICYNDDSSVVKLNSMSLTLNFKGQKTIIHLPLDDFKFQDLTEEEKFKNGVNLSQIFINTIKQQIAYESKFHLNLLGALVNFRKDLDKKLEKENKIFNDKFFD